MEDIHKKIIAIVVVMIVVVAAIVPVVNMVTHTAGDYTDETWHNEDQEYYMTPFSPEERHNPITLINGRLCIISNNAVIDVTPDGVTFTGARNADFDNTGFAVGNGDLYGIPASATSKDDIVKITDGMSIDSNWRITGSYEDGGYIGLGTTDYYAIKPNATSNADIVPVTFSSELGYHNVTYSIGTYSFAFVILSALPNNIIAKAVNGNVEQLFSSEGYKQPITSITGNAMIYKQEVSSNVWELYKIDSNGINTKYTEHQVFTASNSINPIICGVDGKLYVNDVDITPDGIVADNTCHVSGSYEHGGYFTPNSNLSDKIYLIKPNATSKSDVIELQMDTEHIITDLYGQYDTGGYFTAELKIYKIDANITTSSGITNVTPSNIQIITKTHGSNSRIFIGNDLAETFSFSADFPSATFSVTDETTGTTITSANPTIAVIDGWTWETSSTAHVGVRSTLETMVIKSGTTPMFTIEITVPDEYTFASWSIGSSGTISESKNVVLNTTKTPFVITLDADGGTVTPTTITYYVDTTDISLPIPTKDGYTYTDWTDGTSTYSGGVANPYAVFGGDVTLTAEYSLDEYVITLDANGGTVTPPTVEYTAMSASVNIPAASKSGYTFNTWTYSGGTIDSGVLNDPFTVFGGNVTLTASYDMNTYIITLDASPGTVTPTKIEFTPETESIYLPLPTAQTGYGFVQWMNGATGYNYGTIENPFTVFGANDVTLIASYSPEQMAVTLDLNGGTYDGPLVIAFNITTTSITLPTPTGPNGYAFLYWLDAESGSEYMAGTVSNPYDVFGGKSVTLAAQYVILTYTVTLDASPGTVTPTTVTYDVETASITLPTAVREGYVNDKWGDGHAIEVTPGVITDPFDVFGGDAYLEAHYTLIDYTITLNANGGTVTPTTITYNITTSSITLPDADKTGYSFTMWKNMATGLTYDANVPIADPYTVFMHTDVTLTALYQIDTYKITLNPGTGSVSPEQVSFTVESIKIELPTPTLDKFRFDYWENEDTGNTYPAGLLNQPFTIFGANDVTLVAHYTQVVFEWTFAADYTGGEFAVYDAETGEIEHSSNPIVRVMSGWTWSVETSDNTNYIKFVDGTTALKKTVTVTKFPYGMEFDRWSLSGTSGTVSADNTVTVYAHEKYYTITKTNTSAVGRGFDIVGYTDIKPYVMVSENFALKYDGSDVKVFIGDDIYNMEPGNVFTVHPVTRTFEITGTSYDGEYVTILIPTTTRDNYALFSSAIGTVFTTKANPIQIVNDEGWSAGTVNDIHAVVGDAPEVTYHEYMMKSYQIDDIVSESDIASFVVAETDYTVVTFHPWSPSFDAVASVIPLMIVVALLVGVIIYMRQKRAGEDEE